MTFVAAAETAQLEVHPAPATSSVKVNFPKNAFSISKEIAKPKQAYFRGPAQSFAAIFGVVGALATMGDAKSEGEQLAEFMEKQEINVGEMFSTEFEKQIREVDKI